MSKYTNDILASVVVFLVALPLCLGISIASGVPPALGLITGVVGGLVVGFLSGAPLQVSGPAAGLAVLVWELVRDHGIAALGPVLVVAGVIQIVAGQLRVGQWFRAMSPAVVHGMLAGIGVLIFSSQFHVMLDDKPKPNGLENLLSIPTAIFQGIFPIDGSKHELAALTGLVTITMLVLWEKFRPRGLRFLPGALVGVVAGSVMAGYFDLSVQFVKVPANLLDAVQLPGVDLVPKLMQSSVLITAFAVAFIASAETLLSAAAVDQMHSGPRTDYDKELSAQGIGNMLCGIVGALPMTGVIVRSSANVNAGAETRLSTILHGIWILAFVVLFPGVLAMIPVCSLAAILVYTGCKLVNPDYVRRLLKYGKMPVAIYGATLVTIVATDLLTGVIVGVVLSLLKVLYKAARLKIILDLAPERGYAFLELEGAATFLSLPRLARILDKLPPGTDLHVHIERLSYIDHACMELLSNWARQNEKTGSKLHVEWEALEQRYHLEETPA